MGKRTKRHGADVPDGTSAPRLLHSSWGGRPGSESRCAELLQVQVHGSRGVFRPLLAVAHRQFLPLAYEGEACHDGCDGYETDTQGANSASCVEDGYGASSEAPPGILSILCA